MARPKKKDGTFPFGVFLAVASCVTVGGLIVLVATAHGDGSSRLVYKKNSLYHRIFVYKDGPIVSLRFNRKTNVIQGRVNLEKPRVHMLEYSTLALAGLLYNPVPSRVLVLGMGGGVIPRELHHYFPEAEIDVVEIDPAIPDIAQKFFGFQEDEGLRIHVQDGRMYIRRYLRKKGPAYDMIILDAFLSDYIPFHLMTREFLLQVQEILTPGGVVVANVFSNNRLFDSELKTYRDVFGECQVYFGTSSVNAMIVARGPDGELLAKKEAVEKAVALQKKHRFTFLMADVAKRLRPDVKPKPEAEILTDDKAPVNRLRQLQ